MKKIFALALGLMCMTGAMAQEAAEPVFTPVKENAITSIKNQNQAGTCWCYSSLAFIAYYFVLRKQWHFIWF